MIYLTKIDQIYNFVREGLLDHRNQIKITLRITKISTPLSTDNCGYEETTNGVEKLAYVDKHWILSILLLL